MVSASECSGGASDKFDPCGSLYNLTRILQNNIRVNSQALAEIKGQTNFSRQAAENYCYLKGLK